MYIEYEIKSNMDLAEIVTNEFIHMTREEAADVILKITGDFFNYYDGGKEPVVRGKWIEDGYLGLPCVCSYCGNEGRYDMEYCPNCGADMREVEE